ncbi:cytosolic 5'-nucleotidase 1A isoform X4 [Manis javanica]|uniref:cytosolic 5'-nucleotidase 1A isoform X4 n=1 Tax=Manis javanica TaxID=9974 RepID=UPI003C6D9413
MWVLGDYQNRLGENLIGPAVSDLFIERFCMTGGNSPICYLKAYHTNLYLSADAEKVREAIDEGIAAATIFSPSRDVVVSQSQLRVAFDGDAVLFSDESERIVKAHGLDRFFEHEKAHENKPLAQVLHTLPRTPGWSKVAPQDFQPRTTPQAQPQTQPGPPPNLQPSSLLPTQWLPSVSSHPFIEPPPPSLLSHPPFEAPILSLSSHTFSEASIPFQRSPPFSEATTLSPEPCPLPEMPHPIFPSPVSRHPSPQEAPVSLPGGRKAGLLALPRARKCSWVWGLEEPICFRPHQPFLPPAFLPLALGPSRTFKLLGVTLRRLHPGTWWKFPGLELLLLSVLLTIIPEALSPRAQQASVVAPENSFLLLVLSAILGNPGQDKFATKWQAEARDSTAYTPGYPARRVLISKIRSCLPLFPAAVANFFLISWP